MDYTTSTNVTYSFPSPWEDIAATAVVQDNVLTSLVVPYSTGTPISLPPNMEYLSFLKETITQIEAIINPLPA